MTELVKQPRNYRHACLLYVHVRTRTRYYTAHIVDLSGRLFEFPFGIYKY